jgi:hypothetical protein
MEDLSGLVPQEDHWFTRDALPASLLAILAEAGRTYVPLMLANAQALKSGAEKVRAEIDGQPWEQNVFPYQGKCLRWLRDEFASLSPQDRAEANAILKKASCLDLVHKSV